MGTARRDAWLPPEGFHNVYVACYHFLGEHSEEEGGCFQNILIQGVVSMRIKTIRLVVFFFVMLFVLSGCQTLSGGEKRGDSSEKLRVVVSIPPLRDFTTWLGENWVDVTMLVEPGFSPHTLELRPKHIQALAEADVILFNGRGLEPWAKEALQSANPKARVVYVTETERFRTQPYGTNAHLWMSIPWAKEYVRVIHDALAAEVQPESPARGTISVNRIRVLDALDNLQLELERTIKAIPLERRRVAVLHAVWEPFLKPYDFYILQLPKSEKQFHGHTQEIPPNTLFDWANRIETHGVYAVILEEQHPVPALETLCEDIGVPLVYLDPLGGVPGRETYPDMMRHNARKLVEVLAP